MCELLSGALLSLLLCILCSNPTPNSYRDQWELHSGCESTIAGGVSWAWLCKHNVVLGTWYTEMKCKRKNQWLLRLIQYICCSHIAKLFIWCHNQKEKLRLKPEMLQLRIFREACSGGVKKCFSPRVEKCKETYGSVSETFCIGKTEAQLFQADNKRELCGEGHSHKSRGLSKLNLCMSVISTSEISAGPIYHLCGWSQSISYGHSDRSGSSGGGCRRTDIRGTGGRWAEALNTTRGLNIRWCERELSKEIKGGWRRMGERCFTAKQQ